MDSIINKYDSLYEEIKDKSPEEAAKILELSDRYGIAKSLAGEILTKEQISKIKDKPKEFWINLEKEYPNTVKYLDNPYALASLSDDFDMMPFYESWAKQLYRGYMFSKYQHELSDAIQEKINFLKENKPVPKETEEKIEKAKKKLDEQQKLAPGEDRFRPLYHLASQSYNWKEPIVYGLGGAVTGGATALAVGSFIPAPEEVITVPAGAIKGFQAGALIGVAKSSFEMERNFAFDEYVSEYKLPQDKALELADKVGYINSAIESAGDVLLYNLAIQPIGQATKLLASKNPLIAKVLNKITSEPEVFKQMSLRKAITKAVYSMLGTAATEIGQEVAQESVTGIGGELGKKSIGEEYSISEAFKKSKDVIYPTFQTVLLPSLLGGASSIYVESSKINNAKITKKAYEDLSKNTEKFKFKQNSPEQFSKFVKTSTEGTGIENVYLDVDNAKKYFQSKGINFDDVVKELGVEKKYADIKETGGFLEIPIGDWVSKVVGTEHYQNLADDIKFSLDEFTNNELKDIEKISIEEINKKINEEIIDKNDEWAYAFDFVYKNIESGLRNVVNLDKKDLAIQAKAMAYMIINESKNRGENPDDIYNNWIIPKIKTVESDIADSLYQKALEEASQTKGVNIKDNKNLIFNKTLEEFKNEVLPSILPDLKMDVNPDKIYYDLISNAISDIIDINEDVLNQPEVKKILSQKQKIIQSKLNIPETNLNKKDFAESFAERLGSKDVVKAITKKEIPDDVLSKMQGEEIKGFLKDGKSYIVVDNLSPKDIQATILHETIGHYGLRNILEDEDFLKLCYDVMDNYKEYVSEIEKKYKMSINKEGDIFYIGEELVCYILEKAYKEELEQSKIKDIINKYLKNKNIYFNFDVLTLRNIINSTIDWNDEKNIENKINNYIKFSVQSWEDFKKENKQINKKSKEVLDLISNEIKTNFKRYLYEPFREFSSLKSNSDFYILSLDFSTECRRRTEFANTLKYAMKKYYDKFKKIMGKEEIAGLKKNLSMNGVKTSCDACYVESIRLNILSRLPNITNILTKIEESKKYNLNEVKGKKEKEILSDIVKIYPSVFKILRSKYKSEISTSINFVSDVLNIKKEIIDKLDNKEKEVFEKFVDLTQKYISSLGAGGGKKIETKTDYRHEIMKMDEKTINLLNQRSGLRIQSWSDFQVEHTIDLMQAVMDMEHVGLKSHVYTKIIELVDLVKDTNIAVNMSLIPKGNGIKANGELDIDETQSIDFKKGFRLRENYNNIGFVIIGINDEQILKAINTEYIDIVIPYHYSGLGENIRKIYGIGNWVDYAALQKELKLPDGYVDFDDYDNKISLDIFNKDKWYINGIEVKKYNKKERYFYVNPQNERFADVFKKEVSKNLAEKDFDKFYDSFDGDMNKYLDYCRQNRVIPKFFGILQDNGESVVYNNNYYKLIADRRTKTKQGKEYKQKNVEFKFNIKDVLKILNKTPDVDTSIKKEIADKFIDSLDKNGKIYYQGANAFQKIQNNLTRFNIKDIKTGDNDTVYGWGMYTTERGDVSNFYDKNLSWKIIHIDGNIFKVKMIEDSHVSLLLKSAGIEETKDNFVLANSIISEYINNDYNWDKTIEKYKDENNKKQIAEKIIKVFKGEEISNIYGVLVNDNVDFLLWDEPIINQQESIKKKLIDAGFVIHQQDRMFPKGAVSYPKSDIKPKKIMVNGRDLYHGLFYILGGKYKASEFFDKIGVGGIKYKDGSESYSYILFSDKHLKIDRKLNKGAKGYYDVKKHLIALSLENHDVTTFMHESAHFILEEAFNYVISGKASNKYLEMFDNVKKYLNIKDDQKELTEEQHEKFAEGFEKFILSYEGDNKLFYKLKDSFIKIYKNDIKGKIQLDDDIKLFFESLTTAKDFSEDYVDKNAKNVVDKNKKEEMYAKIEEEVLKYFWDNRNKFINEERERVKEEYIKEFTEKNQYSVKCLEKIRKEFNIEDVKKFITKQNFNKEEDFKLRIIAEAYGFNDKNDMFDAITDVLNADIMADKYAEEHINNLNIGSIEEIKEMIKDSFEKNYRKSIIRKEIEYLKTKIKDDELKRTARELLDIEKKSYEKVLSDIVYSYLTEKTTIKESVKFGKFLRHARSYDIKYVKEVSNGNYVNALKNKKNEMFYTEAYIQSFNINKKVKKILEQIKDISKKDNKFFRKEEYKYQIFKLLYRFGFIDEESLYGNGDTLEQWVINKERETNIVDIADWILNENISINYNDLTFSQLLDVHGAIQNILSVARFEERTLTIMKNADFKDIEKQLYESFSLVKDRIASDTKISGYKTIIDKIKYFKNLAKLNLINIETFLLQLDGFKEFGKWWEVFYKPVNDASDVETKMLIEAGEKINNIFKKYSKEELEMFSEPIFIKEINQSLTKEEIMAVALNTGNEINKKRLIEGYGWDENILESILDVLDKKDWDTVQEIWDLLDSYWESISALYKKLTGFEPKKVIPTKVITKYGVYRGGYYPLVRNYRFDPKGLEILDIESSLLDEPPVWKASTQNSHVKQRFVNVKYPVSLDLNVFKKHVYQVIHDLCFREVILDLNRIINLDGVKYSIVQAYGTEGYREFNNWIKALAGNNPSPALEWYERAFKWIRKRFVVSVLFWRLSSMFQQFATFPVVLSFDSKIKPTKLLSKALDVYYKILLSPKEFSELKNMIFSKSIYMASRSESIDRDLNTVMDKIFNKEEGLISFSKSGIAQFDMLVSIPTWLTAYEYGIQEFADENKAIDYADMVVRKTQGSGFIKDLPSIMRGKEMVKIFTMFYSYMNAMLNLFYINIQKQKMGVINNAQFLGKMMGLWIFPVVIAETLAIRAPSPDDEDEFIKFWIKKIIAYPIQTIPFFRDIIDMLMDKILRLKGGGYRITPIQGVGENTGIFISKTFKEDAETIERIEGTAKVLSLLVPYPEQVNILLFNFLDYLDGMNPKLQDLTRRRKESER